MLYKQFCEDIPYQQLISNFLHITFMSSTMEANRLKVARNSLQNVEKYEKNKNYGRAFAHYLVYLELMPDQRQEHLYEFAKTLFNWSVELECKGRLEDLYKCYLQALSYFPLSVEILNRFGTHLIRTEQDYQAKKYLQLANNLDPSNLVVEKNLSTTKINLIPRWHFRMLNDVKRNEAYYEAITKIIDEDYNKVLDIGTGCGLLTLFAAHCKDSANIIAIEESLALTDIAKEVFKINKAINVDIINKYSTDLSHGSVPLSNVLITEIFDTAFFGEHILETLIHAHKNLLEPNFKIVPCFANVYITGLESSHIFKKQRFINHNFKSLKFNDICIRTDFSEPYEAENLEKLDHRLLTNTVKWITIDLNNLEQLEHIFSDKKSIPLVDLHFIENGNLHAFAVWFDLDLVDDVTITTDPFAKDYCKCWEQAIIFIDHPMPKEKGDSITLQMSCAEDKLEVEILDENITCNCFKVSQETIMFLNDKVQLEAIEKVANEIKGGDLVILDLLPFPFFGLCVADKCSQIFTTSTEVELLTKICLLNDIDMSKITYIKDGDFHKYVECDEVFDYIFCIPTLLSGILNESFYHNVDLYKDSLKISGQLLPHKVTLHFQAVESDYLRFCNEVQNINLCNFIISPFINTYMTYEHWNLDPSFSNTVLSETCSKYTIELEDIEPIVENFEIITLKKGRVDGILYWYNYHFPNNISFSTYKSNLYNKACYYVQNVEVTEGDTLEIIVKQHEGHLKICCTKKNNVCE